ncbi:MAG: alpha/beta fold hydrolase [Pseudomonadales bacterium]|nr:alpha/beta fold hydrolase [Pseudomonadales bacterium]
MRMGTASAISRRPAVRLAALLLPLLLSGCTAAISHYIGSQQSFGYDQIASEDTLLQQGFSESEFCSSRTRKCLSYLSAAPLSGKRSLRYRVTIQAQGVEESSQLELDESAAGQYSGLVVLIHGFRASKEYMANSALYFRFLGFHVLLPDLLGHGKSSPGIGFGVEDSTIISELIDQQGLSPAPVLVVGNSLGAVAATRLLAERSDIVGLLLQAPMTVFDQATVNYVNAYSPLPSWMIPDSMVREGALAALQDAGVALEQTDIAAMLTRNDTTPTLILLSDADRVAPPEAFETTLSNSLVSVVVVAGRSHPAMSVIDQRDDRVIQRWLSGLIEANRASEVNRQHHEQRGESENLQHQWRAEA